MASARGLCHTELDEPVDKVIHLAANKLAAPLGAFLLFATLTVLDHPPDLSSGLNVNRRHKCHARLSFLGKPSMA